MGADNALPQSVAGVVVVLLVDLLKAKRSWGWLRLAQGSLALKHVAGLLFAKVMGSGEGGGFRIRPSATHQGLLCVFDELSQAQSFLASPLTDATPRPPTPWQQRVGTSGCCRPGRGH
jgi:spheroidene monooxygenase